MNTTTSAQIYSIQLLNNEILLNFSILKEKYDQLTQESTDLILKQILQLSKLAVDTSDQIKNLLQLRNKLLQQPIKLEPMQCNGKFTVEETYTESAKNHIIYEGIITYYCDCVHDNPEIPYQSQAILTKNNQGEYYLELLHFDM